jgi:hypothetical protein
MTICILLFLNAKGGLGRVGRRCGPGAALFRAVEARRGKLPIIAENLGVLTPEVEAITGGGMAVMRPT